MAWRTAARPPGKNARKKPGRRRLQTRRGSLGAGAWRGALLTGFELCALAAVYLVATIVVLGRAAKWFAGTGLAESLLPFAGTVLVLALAGSALLWTWLWARPRLRRRATLLPLAVALGAALGAGLFARQDSFRSELASLRRLVGGTEEAGRASVAHQVFATYRRSDLAELQRILARVDPYLPAIRRAAEANGIDDEVLVGIGAAESSFVPRTSKDGGRGLFQITTPPKVAVDAVRKQIGTDRPDPLDQTHNAFLAAATLRHYLRDMKGDLFLGLLAYNIGPRNGGLRSIMNQYHAHDFVTIQPYLQNLPRDYPVRVLTGALAYRLWRIDGKLPRYEEEDNARHIQKIGIPGLAEDSGSTDPLRQTGDPDPPA